MKQRCDTFHNIAFDRSKWLGIAQMENTIRLSHKPDISLDISSYYQSPAIQGTFDVDPSWSVSVGAKWTFDKVRASLTARCSDIFESADPAVRIRYAGQHVDMDSGRDTRTFTLRFSYRLGSYKEKKRINVKFRWCNLVRYLNSLRRLPRQGLLHAPSPARAAHAEPVCPRWRVNAKIPCSTLPKLYPLIAAFDPKLRGA